MEYFYALRAFFFFYSIKFFYRRYGMRGYKNLRLRVRASEDFALRLFFFIKRRLRNALCAEDFYRAVLILLVSLWVSIFLV